MHSSRELHCFVGRVDAVGLAQQGSATRTWPDHSASGVGIGLVTLLHVANERSRARVADRAVQFCAVDRPLTAGLIRQKAWTNPINIEMSASALFWTSRFRQRLTGLYAGVR
jgi:hypothetical protein